MTQKKPKLGVLALMLEDYLPLFPGIDRAQTAYVNEVLDGLQDAAEFVFPARSHEPGADRVACGAI